MSTRPGASNSSAGTLPQQILEYLSYPFASCFPSTSRQSTSNNSNNERQGLLDESRYDDSDAISLLSNIADRSRRRSRSARRREEWRKRAAVVGCGLFGRPKGQIQRREVTSGDALRSQQERHHRRTDSEESGGSLGAESEDDHDPPRSIASSLGGVQESGDEDAGMLGDEDIAELSNSKDANDGEEEEAQQVVPTVRVSEAEDSSESSAGPPNRQPSEEEREAQERAALKARLEKEAEEYAKAQAEDAVRLAAEEAALAAEEEEAAVVAKAKRKAERRAAKEEMLRKQMASERARRRTEADAEAAAGGFDFAEEPEDSPPQYDQGRYEEYEQEADYQSPQLQQPEVVHHHHYYHEPAPEEETFDDTLLSPNFRIHDLPTFPSQEKATEETPVEEDEDDADIAGLGFSKSKKNRSRGEGGGSNSFSAGGRSNGSGSGSWQSGSANGQARSRYEAHRQGSDHSAHRERVGGQSSSAGKRSYRDRPRKQHERTTSKSTGSGAGYTAREGIPHRRTSASPLSFEADEQRADAAAGGFDDFVPPPSAPAPPSSYRDRERRGNADSNSASSQGRARERPRERRSSAQEHQGLNAPRNPRGANVFVQDRDDADIF